METFIKDASELTGKLEALKIAIIEQTASNDTTGTHGIMSQVHKMDDITDELKELLILLHSNTKTDEVRNKTNNIKTHIAIIDIMSKVISKQGTLLHMINEAKPSPVTAGKLVTIFTYLKLTKTTIPLLGLIGFALFWLGSWVSPETTTLAVTALKELF